MNKIDFSQYKRAIKDPDSDNKFILEHKEDMFQNKQIRLDIYYDGPKPSIEWIGLSLAAINELDQHGFEA